MPRFTTIAKEIVTYLSAPEITGCLDAEERLHSAVYFPSTLLALARTFCNVRGGVGDKRDSLTGRVDFRQGISEPR